MSRPRKRIKVIYVKLGRQKIWGQSGGDFEIEVDPRCKGRKLLEILTHECLHELWPEASEDDIITKAAILTRTLWHEGARMLQAEDKEPLQDENKK